MSVTAFTFPGQGSQAVGMGKDLAAAYPEARQVFQEVDEALGERLSATMFEGPEDILRLTENAQPALMAVSMAVIRVLEARGVSIKDHAKFVAGHSLGEYSALCAAGTFTIADAARLLRTRGQAMQKAVPVGHGAMAALLGLDVETARQVAAEAGRGEVCDVANDNAPGQVVVSGATGAVERAVEIAKTKGAKRALLLPVSAPFHCSMMQPAADAMATALAEVSMQAPVVPLVANVLAAPISDPAEIRQRLVEQVTGVVRWTESVSWLTTTGGVTNLVELGSGKVLTGLAKRIAPQATAQAIGTPADIDAFVAQLGA
ncbi:ACP S-malonyltransferase [Devosia sp. 63-57]|uniref:ACP S-malonyltransferase n=1 Tax=Devosia sp. 63-57 TaxID=1895751 RepID=UPI00086D2866|nr:ACP S-malonyltransferase [Devosia sp. 63-57]ODT47114.1 MAG: [acyl-carrier-protein] S-malonyltransferase [Pelagibacterium sp. SCN 63-126]ODU88929.1 MAG: [acyl-carrier-protein] S-malonyltransferase [Pelagibacterium sp. SCN 63-17]OJX43175.1 MAG: [acyl-carrier-protein] S-malonyltransferase [Devosia sp. 63-57]